MFEINRLPVDISNLFTLSDTALCVVTWSDDTVSEGLTTAGEYRDCPGSRSYLRLSLTGFLAVRRKATRSGSLEEEAGSAGQFRQADPQVS